MVATAQHLRIRVTDGDRPKADVTLQARLAEHLADLIPPDLKPVLDGRGIDVHAIAASAVETGFAPAELFRLEDGAKAVCIWLE